MGIFGKTGVKITERSLIAEKRTKRFLETILGSKNFTLRALSYVCILILLSQWLPNIIEKLIEIISVSPGKYINQIIRLDFSISGAIWILKSIFSMGIILYFVIIIRKISKTKQIIKIDVHDSEKVKVLLINLSSVAWDKIKDRIENKSLTEIDLINERVAWLMPLKAIKYHASVLEKIYILTSIQTSVLFKSFQKFIDYFIDPPISGKIQELVPGGVDFNRIDLMYDALDDFWNKCWKENYRQRDILIDVTGGMVTTSIAGVLFSLVNGRRFQYVNTNDPNKVQSYDLLAIPEKH